MVGEARYRAACEWAWRTGSGTGFGEGERWPDDLAEVPHDLADPLWHAGRESADQRLDLALRLIGEMPCYGNLMYLKHAFGDLGPRGREVFWRTYRGWLEDDRPSLADPASYSLWCDYYEDQDTVAEAWRETTVMHGSRWTRRLERALANAGPVPWGLKEALFAHLVGDPRWHEPIFLALRGSAFDVYGHLDRPAALLWLGRLDLPADTPDLPALRARLWNPRWGLPERNQKT